MVTFNSYVKLPCVSDSISWQIYYPNRLRWNLPVEFERVAGPFLFEEDPGFIFSICWFHLKREPREPAGPQIWNIQRLHETNVHKCVSLYPLVNKHSYEKSPFLVGFPMKDGDFPARYVSHCHFP